jgi:hypothetical protein
MDTRISHLNKKPFFITTRQKNTQAETKQGGKNFSRPDKLAFPFLFCLFLLFVTARRNSAHYNRIMESLFFTVVSNSYPGARRRKRRGV